MSAMPLLSGALLAAPDLHEVEAVGDVGENRFAGVPATGHQVGEERVEIGDRFESLPDETEID